MLESLFVNSCKISGEEKLYTDEFGYSSDSRFHDMTSIERDVGQSILAFIRDVA